MCANHCYSPIGVDLCVSAWMILIVHSEARKLLLDFFLPSFPSFVFLYLLSPCFDHDSRMMLMKLPCCPSTRLACNGGGARYVAIPPVAGWSLSQL